MHLNLTAFLFALGAVILAEMGDKTQLLAMAFATRYKMGKVLAGVFVATVLNHALAVVLGNLIAHIQSVRVWIEGIAALSFIFFGLWTIRGDRLEGGQDRKTRFGAVVTVAIAFFIAELGDKTQLATIALAARFPNSPAGILAGTTAGMVIADGIGIVVSVIMCKKIPERIIKLLSAAAFAFFGFLGIYQVASEKLGLSALATAAILVALAAVTGIAAYILVRADKRERDENPAAGFCVSKNTEPAPEGK